VGSGPEESRLTVVAHEILGSRYRLTGHLGAGGMGVVWRGHDEVLDREVAVKLLAPQFARDADSRARILAEARAAARLTHPHVARVYDYGESAADPRNPVPYVVMELLHGRSLQERLERGNLPVEQSLRICAEVASALAAAHATGLVHRDVKPGNVMLTAAGAKVVDFGLAAVAGELDHSEGALIFGTPAYVAPERLNGHPVVAATDVYALGLLLYRLLAGRLPWDAETSTQMIEAHAYVDPAPLPRVRGLPPVVASLVQRCLSKEPLRRPPSSEVTVTLAQAAGIRVPLDGIEDEEPEEVGAVSRSGGPGPAGTEPYVLRLAKYLDSSLDHVDLRRQASTLLGGSVGFDLAIWAVLDPMTLMWASCVVDGGPYAPGFEDQLFANEYGEEDVLKLADLAETGRIGTIWAATDGDPTTSRRYRNVLRPHGFEDELRMTFSDAGGTWGALVLLRANGRFGAEDVAHLAPAAQPLGAALHHALGRAPDASGEPTPGRLTMSHDGRLLDLTESARLVLDAAELDRVGTAVARGRWSGLVDTSGGIRRDGRWLAFEATQQRKSIDVAVQRIRPHELSEFVVRAHGLDVWHWRVLGAVARGRNTRQAAADLGLSIYQVQDGLTALFGAFGVSGRIDLLKALFFDHYVPLHAADGVVTHP
jgi:hypothetical protein